MEELFSLIRVYLFFALYEFIAVAFILIVFYKPKFVFQRSRWNETDLEIPKWIKVAAIGNLFIGSIFLGIISYFWNLFNFMDFY
ncbi:MAG: hypothetical protein KC493_00860 [Bacteriovoracaceae bacterium]|nr:hypothetical protein [Bacteriovoracaceae bacterium]